MLFKNISIIDENQEFKKNMYVGTVDDKIVYVSNQEPAAEEAAKYGEVYDGNNKLLMSAFYNPHAHCGMVLLRSRADKLPLQDWLEKNNFPFEAKMTADDHKWGMLMGLAEMARYGIVSCTDMYFESDLRAQIIEETKMKANIAESISDFEGVEFKDHQMYAYVNDLVKNWHNKANGRVKVDACMHSEYITTEKLCRTMGEFAVDNDLILTFHMSETQLENAQCKERHEGLTPSQYFKKIGVFNAKTTIAHAVWLTDEDMQILKESNASLVTCACSNMKLGSGFANIPEWIKRGINFGIGTDGACSNNNYNFINDMYVTSLICKGINNDPTVASAEDILYAGTRGGALAQGREDCGLLKVGFKADLCVMDLTEPIWCPETNYINNLIYAGQGSDICLTMCDGEIVYKDGTWPTIDVEKA